MDQKTKKELQEAYEHTLKERDTLIEENEELIADAERRQLNVYQRIAAVMGEMRMLGETQENTHDRFRFAGHNAFSEAIRPLLAKHGLVLWFRQTKEPEFESAGHPLSKDSIVTVYCAMTVINADDPDDQSHEYTWVQKNRIMGGKGTGSAVSYARKYLLRDVFLMTSGDESDDLDSQPQHEPSYDRRDAQVQPAQPITRGQRELLRDAAERNGLIPEMVREKIQSMGCSNSSELTTGQFDELMGWIETHSDDAPADDPQASATDGLAADGADPGEVDHRDDDLY